MGICCGTCPEKTPIPYFPIPWFYFRQSSSNVSYSESRDNTVSKTRAMCREQSVFLSSIDLGFFDWAVVLCFWGKERAIPRKVIYPSPLGLGCWSPVTFVVAFFVGKPEEVANHPFWFRHRAFPLGACQCFPSIFVSRAARLELDYAAVVHRLCSWSLGTFPPPPLRGSAVRRLAVSECYPRGGTREDVRKTDDEETRYDGCREQGGGHPRPGVEMRRRHSR